MRKKIGIIFISLFCFMAVAAWLLTADETMAADAQEMSCVIGDANYSGAFEVGDLVRLKRHLKTTELACSMDGDLDVSGDLASADVVRCREMLVGDRSLQVSVAKEDWYKQLKDADGYNAYYKLNKSLKAGWTLTFKVDFKENTNCSVYGYYPGSDEWIYIGNQSDEGRLRLVAEQDIAYLNIRVVNADNQTEISDFRVYDIKVYKDGYAGAVKDLAVTHNQSTDMPVVYGTSDTLDLTKFGVETNEKNLSYKWTIKQNGVDNSTKTLDMTSTKYPFTATGNYTITATVNTEGYSGSASAKIMVVNPKIYIGFDGGTVKNTGTATNTVGAYGMDALSGATKFTSYSGTVAYTTGINGDAKGAIVTNHYSGPYTVVKDYAFGTSNFTLSAWINVPKSAELSVGSATYLFGTMNPDGKDGFALSLKEGELRVKLLSKEADMHPISFERDSWYNITLKRQGASLKLYFDGKMIKDYAIDKAATFGTKDLAFGAYYGLGSAYKNAKMLYDDIQIYSGSLGDATIATLAAVDSVGADVAISFDNGKVENTGMKSANVGTFALKSDGSDFGDFSGTVRYSKDAQGKDNGAIITSHRSGPHTVVEDHKLGTNNFTISTWFNVPVDELGNNSQAYLFGTDNPNTSTGLAVNIKYDTDKEEYQLRFKVGNISAKFCKIEDFTENTWYHLAACRDGSDIRWYLNGKCVYTIPDVTTNFGTEDISFGAGKNWASSEYGAFKVHFDDVRIYSSAVATKYIKEIYNNAVGPQVEINYTDSTVANTGADTDVAVGTYKMKATKGDDNMFVTQPSVPFTTGAAYDKGGAISTYHYDGTYTVVRDYVLGTKDFSISTWVKIPEDAEVSTGSGTYLFGNDHVATTNGFAVCLKPDQLRVQLAGSTLNTGDLDDGSIYYEPGKWYHVALTREGADVKVYFDGYLVATISDKIKATHDFGTADLAFGAYPGPYAYKEASTYFDEIKIYDSVLSEDSIATTAYTDLGEEEWLLNGEYIIDESLPSYISNNKLFYTNDIPVADKTSGADPSCIYVTEGDLAGYYITYIGFNSSTQVKCYKSKDLVSWETADSVEKRCFDPCSDSASWVEKDNVNYGTNLWAPEVYYDAASKTYYMFYSAKMDHKKDSDAYRCLGLATSKSPIGPFKDIGKPIFDGSQLAKQNTDFNKIGLIDPHPFVDPVSGEKYLYMARCRDGSVTSNVVCAVKMKDWETPDYSTFKYLTTVDRTTQGGSVATERVETGADGPINEAPQMIYHNGKYYLTMSIRGTTEKEYSVIQAIGDSPTGPFTKVQQSKGGVVLGNDLQKNYAWDHFSCSGSHSFIQAGDEWFIVYHTHTDPDVPGYVRSLAVDRMTWATNSDGQTIMKAMGPSKSVQPKPASYSGYANIAPKATMTATNTASGSKASYLNDGLVRILSTDNINQFEGSNDVTITMKFDDFVKARSLLIYNSWNYADSFDYISNVTFTYGELVDGVRHVGTKTVNDIYFEESTYTYTNHEGKTLMIPGAPVVLSLADGVEDLEIIEVSITIPRASGKSKVAVSEVMLLGKDFEEKADVQVSYNNGTIADASTDDAVTVGAYGLSGIDKDASSVFQKYAGAFKFTTGVAGDAKGAIVTNNATGPYTVVNGYNFGSDNFTVSTWFKVPAGQTIQDSGNYLFGIDNPDGTTGFSACIKYTTTDGYQLRLRVLNKTLSMHTMSDFAFDTWYKLTLSRTGNTYNWYLDGKLVGTYTDTTSIVDFGSKSFAVGAYKAWGKGSYKNTDICFDEVSIYDSALSQEKIAALTAKYKN